MLRCDQFDEIEAMIGQRKLSLRKIARKLGVSRGTVLAISQGECRRQPRRRSPPADGLPDNAGPYVRCPTCGHRVQMPCLICRLRQRAFGARPETPSEQWPSGPMQPGQPGPGQPGPGQPGPGQPGPGVVVGLELRGEHLERYREVCAERLRRQQARRQRRRRRQARRRRLANLAAMAAKEVAGS